ncbi:MAG: amidohydrolase family protein [Candidatus Aminicenantes bacterium]|jgi:imidazolonepropionase-like amidohydrolase
MITMRTQLFFIAFILIILNLAVWPGSGDTDDVLVLEADRILTISHGKISEGKILIREGKIEKVGKEFEIPEDAKIIDLKDRWILPGLIESHTTLGAGSRYEGPNADEISAPNTAQLKIIDAINPFNKNIKYTRMAGITSGMLTPGRQNVIGGQTAVVKFRGKTVSEMILREPAGLKFSLGEGPKTTYGSKGRLPSTRMGSAYLIRKALLEAEDYIRQWDNYTRTKAKDKEVKPPKRDLKLEPLAQVRMGKLTAFFECYRVDDILTVLRILDEFSLEGVLVGCTEGYKVAEEIAKREVPVIVSPFGVGPRRMETQDITIKNAAILASSGVKVIIKGEEAFGVGTIRELPLLTAFAVKGGLERDLALRAITLSAAEVLGVADRIGSIEPDKDADLVVLSGDPFHYRTFVERVYIDGKMVYENNH